jgi:4-amino-4-deoxy-L-arabinose transferase-like glycosyltransferase
LHYIFFLRMRADLISDETYTVTLVPNPEPLAVNTQPRRWKTNLLRAAVAGLFFALIVVLQWLSGAYRNEFAGYPDEGAHYITGLMIHDFVARHSLSSFRQFAENYYAHYPKVAIGHWPPFFYVVQAAWTLLFPISRTSLLLLMAIFTAAMAFTLYRIVEDEFGTLLGVVAGLFLLSLPVIQAYSGMVMADTLVGLLSFWTVLSFARFMDRARWQDAVWFGILSALTILTKGTGLALALVPPLALLFTGRWTLVRRPAFWLPVAIVVPLCAPWYWFTRHMLPNTWQQPQPGLSYVAKALRFYSWHSLHVTGIVLAALTVVGFVVQIVLPRRERVKSKWAVLAALLFSTALLALVVPAGLEERFLIPAVPAALAFAAAGLDFLAGWLSPRMSLPIRRLVLICLVIALFLLGTFTIPRSVSFGFAPVAEYLLSQSDLAKAVLLVSSDATGDSMFISELAMREARPGHYVLRASKILCNCSWSGEQHAARFSNPEALMNFLDHSPIQIVLNDESIPARRDFHRMLDQTIAAYSQRWHLLGTYPVTRNGVLYPRGVLVYSVSGTDPSASVNIDLRRMLNKTIQLQPR